MTRVRVLLGLVVLTSMLASPVIAAADSGAERILAFHSTIIVASDGSLVVTEIIKVNVTGTTIHHGIYRDLKSSYRDQTGRTHFGTSRVVSVKRDGAGEPYFIKEVDDGMRIYCGDAGTTLAPGEYTYELQYSADRQILAEDSHDVLYWDVTGTEWPFPLDAVTANVILPQAVDPDLVHLSGFTGQADSVEADCTVEFVGQDEIVCATTRPLAAGENLTIAVEMPKGILNLPAETRIPPTSPSDSGSGAAQTAEQRTRAEMVLSEAAYGPHNQPAHAKSGLIGILGLLFLAGYYWLTWHLAGRDPPQRQAPLRGTPPDGISPAAVRFIERMRFDDIALAAALINLAGTGRLSITSAPGCRYLLTKSAPDCDGLPTEEQVLWNALLQQRDKLELIRENHAVINHAREAFSWALHKNFAGLVFKTNQAYIWGGIAISAIISLLMIGTAPSPLTLTGMTILCALTWGAYIFPLRPLVKYMFPPYAGSPACGANATPINPIGPIIQVCLLLPVSLTILFIMAANSSWPVAIAVGGMIILNVIFSFLLPTYTIPGRKLMDEIGGFRQWLVSATPTDQSPDNAGRLTRREAYLPYAMALGIEQQWSDHFTASLRDSRQPSSPDRPAESEATLLDQARLRRLVSRSVTDAFQRSLTASRKPPPTQRSGPPYRSRGHSSFSSRSSRSSRPRSSSSRRSSGGGRGGRGGGGW